MKKFLTILLVLLILGTCATTDANARRRRSSGGGSRAKATPEAVKDAYIKQLQAMDDAYDCDRYFIYDISGDKVPELFVITGDCEMEYALHIFTYSSGKAKNVFKSLPGYAGHAGFGGGNNCLECGKYHMGSGAYWKLTLRGNKVKQSRSSSSAFERSSDIDNYGVGSYTPLENMSF